MRFGRGRLDPPVGVVGHDELADLAAFARESKGALGRPQLSASPRRNVRCLHIPDG